MVLRTLALFAATTVIALIVSLSQTAAHLATARTQATAAALLVAESAAHEIEERLERGVASARVIENFPDFWDGTDADRDRILSALASPQPELNALLFYTPDFEQHGASNHEPGRSRPEISSRAYAREAIQTGRLSVTDEPLRALDRGVGVLPLAVPVQDRRDPARSGLVVVGLRLERVSGIWDTTPLPEGSSVVLADLRTGRVLAATGTAGRPAPDFLSLERLDTMRATRIAHPRAIPEDEGGLGGWVAIKDTPWVVCVKVPSDIVLGPVYRTATTFTIAHLATATVAFVVLCLLRRSLIARLGRLRASANAWAGGDWAHRTSATGDDEIGHLGDAFNSMAAELQRSTSELAREQAARERNLARQSALLEIARSFAIETDLDHLLDEVVRRAIAIVGAEHGSIRRWDEHRQTLVTARWTLGEISAGFEVAPGHGAVGLAVLRRAPVTINNYREAPVAVGTARDAGIEASLAVPLIHEERLVGALAVSTTVPGTIFTDHDAETLDLLGQLAAATLVGLEREATLREAAGTDPLTGLANRRRGLLELEQLLGLAARQNAPVALAVIDLDHFKRINDVHGHAVGDEVLRRVGTLLRQTFRAEDVVARWGGEEILVAMYGSTAAHGVRRMTELLDQLRWEAFDGAGNQPFRVTFSGGVAQAPGHGTTVDALCAAADSALYHAKAQGRARVLEAADAEALLATQQA